MRDGCIAWYDEYSSKQIGGTGMIVEIDETQMIKRKNGVGRVLPEIWVLGGICRQTGDFIF